MGRTFQFECPWCQYRAQLSGGADSGINCEVQTIICRDCRQLFDVLTRLRRRQPEKNAQPTQRFRALRPEIPPAVLRNGSFHPLNHPVPPLIWEAARLACPSNPKHVVEPWNDPGRCPRCGNFMEKVGWPFRLWE